VAKPEPEGRHDQSEAKTVIRRDGSDDAHVDPIFPASGVDALLQTVRSSPAVRIIGERLGDAAELEVEFPLPDWSFTALCTRSGDDCSRVQEIPVEVRNDGTFILRPAGLAGTYDVTLFGRGQGDLSVAFKWTTPQDGPLPVPEARLAILSDSGGSIESYGAELEPSVALNFQPTLPALS
jgi:hypothetical protein